MRDLEKKLNYTFRNQALLEEALNHSSYANENKSKGETSNERLEFLGDSILGLVVADHLYRTRPDLPEGDLTRIRAALVCEGSLVQVAQALDLGSYLKLGKGEDHGGGRARPSIQADAVEAMLAAVYLDGGIGQVRKLIHRLVLDQEQEKTAAGRDYKTALQELVQDSLPGGQDGLCVHALGQGLRLLLGGAAGQHHGQGQGRRQQRHDPLFHGLSSSISSDRA